MTNFILQAMYISEVMCRKKWSKWEVLAGASIKILLKKLFQSNSTVSMCSIVKRLDKIIFYYRDLEKYFLFFSFFVATNIFMIKAYCLLALKLILIMSSFKAKDYIVIIVR